MKRFFNFLLPMFVLLMCIGHVEKASAKGETWYAKLTVKGGDVGKGYIYGNTTNTVTPIYGTTNVDVDDEKSSQNADVTYYAWAHPVRGAVFTGWTVTGNGVQSHSDSGTADAFAMKKSNNNSGGSNNAVATANWTVYKPCTVHLHSSSDGAYSIQYAYSDYDAETNNFKDFDPGLPIGVDAETQDVILYYTDNITLTINSGTFQGWFKDAACTQSLDNVSGSGPYTLVVPNNTEMNTELHIYPKFAVQPKIYGKVNIESALGSADGAGSFGVIDVDGIDPDWETTSASCSHISLTTESSISQTYYLHAKLSNQEQYAFAGWYSSKIPSAGTLLSTDLNYNYTFSATGTTAGNATEKTVYALFVRISTHYFEMTAEPATPGTGMVCASDAQLTNPGYAMFTNFSQSTTEWIGLANRAQDVKYYMYATPKYGYKFDGWYSDAACSSRLSTANPYTYSATTSSVDPTNPDKAHLYAKFVLADPVSVTFEYPTNGTYSARVRDIVVEDGEYVWGETDAIYNSAEQTGNVTIQMYPTTMLNLHAEPASGYAVKSWKTGTKTVTSGSNNTTVAVSNGNTFGVTFGESRPFLVVGGQAYSTLTEALANRGSRTTISVVEDATLTEGEYVIPKGVTLLIPFDDANTIKTTLSHNKTNTALSKFRELKIEDGAKIVVNGTMVVSGNQYHASGGSKSGIPCGPSGFVKFLGENSQIVVNNGGTLYTYGFIYGEGSVTINDGATLYELMQLLDWKGGTCSSGIVSKMFPFTQYSIQSIESKLTLKAGAKEYVYLGISGSMGLDQCTNVQFVGNASSEAFLKVGSGQIIRTYNVNIDQTLYTIDAETSIGSISMFGYSTSSAVMSISSALAFKVTSGHTFTMPYSMVLEPGVYVEIEEGAVVNLGTGGRTQYHIYLLDADEWVGKGYANGANYQSTPYIATTGKAPGARNQSDSRILINGTVNVKSNYGVYTSAGGANICSDGTGVFNVENAFSATSSAYEVKSTDKKNLTEIVCNSAWLRNKDNSYVRTLNYGAGAYTYFMGEWRHNMTIDGCFIVDEVGHRFIKTSTTYVDVKASDVYTNAWESRDVATRLFIHTTNDCDWLEVLAVAGNTTYLQDKEGNYYEYNSTKGYWVPATQYTATFKNFNGKVLYTTKVFPNGTPIYKGATPIRPTDDEGVYSFSSWTPAIGAINVNTEYTAQFNKTPHVASVNSLGVTTYYTTWASALAYANAQTTTPTLKLLGDVSGISAVQTISKSMTLDLNGHTLSGTVSEMLKVNSAITLTITDGSVGQTGVISSVGTAASNNYYTMSVAKGKVILENGTLKGKANGASVFPILINTSGTFEMEGGCITTDATGTNNHGMLVKTKNTFIKGGTIDVPGAAVYISSGYSGAEKMTISGGYIKGGTIINSGNSADTRVNVTGGYFSTNASLSSLVATPYHVFDNEEDSRATYPYTVAEAYNVTFKNGETVLQEGLVKKGATPAYTGATPTKDADAQYTYTFSTWSPAISAVSDADQEYVAQFDQTPKSYTLTWNLNGGDITTPGTAAGSVAFGTSLTAPVVEKMGYTFNGWSPAVPATMPAANATYIAQWRANQYTVSWDAAGGELSGEYTHGSVDYGTTIVSPTATKDGYVFESWSPTVPATVTGNLSFTAQWRAAETGDYLDIVDWTDSTLTINTNALAASGWPYTINDVQYQKTARLEDRTLTIPYIGSADGALDITVNNKNSETVSKHSYTIPHIYDTNASIGGVNENSIVYIHSGATVSVNANTSVKAIYVAPDADLVVNNGVTLTLADKLVLRTTPWAAAALDNRGTISGGQVYYSYIIANKDQQYYQFAMPLASNTDNVKTSDEVANNRATECPYNTAWLMKDYSESSRANNGVTGNNWVALVPGVIRGTVGYELFSMSKYYREYYFPVTLPNTPATTVTVQYTNGSNAADNGWNAVCSPMTKAFTQSFANPARALKVSELMEDGRYWQHIQETIRPATPFYYQASQGQTQLVFGSEMTASAPYRAIDNEEVATEWLQVNYGDAQGHSDETNIFLHPTDFVVDYENGLDVAKLSTTGARPFLYISLACGDLAFAALPDEAAQRIPLTVYSPANGEYTFSLIDNDYMGRMAAVYLVDEQMGTYTDLLNGDTYSVAVEQGTTAGRFYLMAEFAPAPGVTTGMDEAESADSMIVEKVFINGLFYIRRGGELYDWNGRLVK